MKQLFRLTIIVAAFILTGCSAFNYEWRQAAKQPGAASARDITGRWEGRWSSKSSGHENKMRALIARRDTNHYDVKFHAAYKVFKFIPVRFGYTVRMETKPSTNDSVAFRGSEDLGGLAGGVYTYEGHADATNFFSTYKSKYDRGVFEMKRPWKTISKTGDVRSRATPVH
ncbi:MAG TPA: hypothetical protein VGF13_18250 [Verrucomicrobiae bacterium]|jgi:hypothetical protein